MASVLVVGAGIAGLATAMRLRRSGWQVTVVERAPSLRGGGYMIGFSGIGYRAARSWGLLPALEERQPPMVDLVYVDYTGTQRARLPVAAQQAMVGKELLALLRGDLEEVLFEALDDAVDVRFGTTVTGIVQAGDEVSVRLSDGAELTFDLVVGADGLHSKVRELVFGPERGFRRDLGAAIGTVLLDQRPAGVPTDQTVSMNLVGRGVGIYTTRTGGAAFFGFATDDADADLAAGARTTLRRVYGDLGWAVPELLDQVDASDSVYFDAVSQIVMDRWSRGRVVLLGDAAWCVSLMAGYGSSLAVGGAELLGQALDAHDDVPAALDRWERDLRPVAEKKQRQGRRARGLFVARSQTALAFQYTLYRLAGSRTIRDLAIPAGDGVTLLADRYYPAVDERAPLVLIRTPYGRGSANRLIARMFAQRGYQVLMVALRGTDGSGGTFDGFTMNRADGPAVIAWLREQDWFSGSFATWGASYLGYAQWDLASTPIPEWKAAIMDVAPSDFYHYFMYPGGVFALGNALGWAQLVHSLFRDGRSTNPSTMSAFTATGRLARACDRLPIAEADRVATGARISYYQDWIAHETYDEFWEQSNYRANVPNLPPVVHIGGDWPDFFLPNQLDDYAEIVRTGRTVRLLVGSAQHGQNLATRTYLRDAFATLDAALGMKQASSLDGVPAVRLKLTGRPQWRTATAWPPTHAPTPWYLHPGGALSTSVAEPSEPTRYRYAPATATPAVGGTAVGLRAGAKDNRSLEARPDVVTFTSEVLPHHLTAIGPVSASIFAQSSLPTFDVFVRVCDVHPNGRSVNVCDGIARVHAPAGHIHGVAVTLWPMGHVFRRGHRLRVQVSSGAHPRFARNLGTDEPLASATTPRAAEQQIHHGPAYPSAIVLPMADGPVAMEH